MKILFVSYYSPLGQGGFEKQTLGLFRTLIASGHQIACLCGTKPGEAATLKQEIESTELFSLGVYIVEYEERSYNLLTKILFWLVKNPSNFLGKQFTIFGSLFQQKFELLFHSLNIDAIHCLGLRTTYFLPKDSDYPLVIDLVDCMSQHKQREITYLYKEKKYKKLLSSLIDLQKTRKIERDILSSHTEAPITVVAKSDRQMLEQIYPHASINVVSHPVAIKASNLLQKENTKCQSLVFYGFMNTIWNIDAFNFLVHQIMPLVIQVKPRIKLKLTGLHLTSEIIALKDRYSWLEIIENVENISQFLSQATLTCWAFRYGSGVKNKILESMYLGKPVVTTNIGAEAFNESQKRGMLIADEPQKLANYIIYLLNNPEECQRLGRINQQIIATDFTWEQKAQDYLNLYQIARQKKIENKPLVTTI